MSTRNNNQQVIRHSGELFAECVVYNVNAKKASCNSEVFSRSIGLTISFLGKRRHG